MANTKKPEINLTNYVSKAEISGFDVDVILKKIPGAKFRPNKFPATVIVTKNDRIHLYDSGKISSIKNKTEEMAIKSICDFLDKLTNIGVRCNIQSKPGISLITAVIPSDNPFDFDALRNNANYAGEVRSFPAIQMKYADTVTVKIFEKKLVMSAQDIQSMIPVINDIFRYTKKRNDTP